MKIITFYSNSKYAGGRSHRNINTLEFVEDKDMMEAAEHYAYHLYPAVGEDFEGGVKDWNGNEILDADEYKSFVETGVGRLDFGETVFVSKKLEDISESEFKILPKELQLEYVNIWYENVTEDMLDYAIDSEGASQVFEYGSKEWDIVIEEIKEKEAEDE